APREREVLRRIPHGDRSDLVKRRLLLRAVLLEHATAELRLEVHRALVLTTHAIRGSSPPPRVELEREDFERILDRDAHERLHSDLIAGDRHESSPHARRTTRAVWSTCAPRARATCAVG